MNIVTKTKINKLMDLIGERLVYLYDRWQDEKEYEDFAKYITAMKKDFKTHCETVPMKNAVYVKAGKRPFGFTFDFEGWKVVMSVNSTSVKWGATRPKKKNN